MKITEQVDKPTTVTKDVICDRCGKSCVIEMGKVKIIEAGELSAFWGFGSKQDGENRHYDLCEECFDKVAEFIKAGVPK